MKSQRTIYTFAGGATVAVLLTVGVLVSAQSPATVAAGSTSLEVAPTTVAPVVAVPNIPSVTTAPSVVSTDRAKYPRAKPAAAETSTSAKTFILDAKNVGRADEVSIGANQAVVNHRCLDAGCSALIASVKDNGSSKLWLAKRTGANRFTVQDEVNIGSIKSNQVLNSGNLFASTQDPNVNQCNDEFAGLYSIDGAMINIERSWTINVASIDERDTQGLTVMDTCEG